MLIYLTLIETIIGTFEQVSYWRKRHTLCYKSQSLYCYWWLVMCLVKWCLSRKDSPQILQRNFSSRFFLTGSVTEEGLWWDRIWYTKSEVIRKDALHFAHQLVCGKERAAKEGGKNGIRDDPTADFDGESCEDSPSALEFFLLLWEWEGFVGWGGHGGRDPKRDVRGLLENGWDKRELALETGVIGGGIALGGKKPLPAEDMLYKEDKSENGSVCPELEDGIIDDWDAGMPLHLSTFLNALGVSERTLLLTSEVLSWECIRLYWFWLENDCRCRSCCWDAWNDWILADNWAASPSNFTPLFPVFLGSLGLPRVVFFFFARGGDDSNCWTW